MKRVLLLAALGILAACVGDGGAGPGTGSTAVYLSDDPFPFDDVSRVDVHIVKVEVTQGDTADVTVPWLTVAEPNRAFNLLDLQQGTSTLLGSADLPPGHYGAVRLQLDTDKSSIMMADGTVLRGVVGDRPGILWQSSEGRPILQALVFEPVAVAENGADVVIDFDAGRSFLPIGPNRFVFSPYIRAVNRQETGAVSGTVVASDIEGAPVAVARATVEAYVEYQGNAGSLAGTGMTDAAGHFTIAFLAPMPYAIRVTGPAAIPGFVQRGHVQVVAGESVEAGTLILGPALPEPPPSPPVDSTGAPPPPPPPPPPGTDTLTIRRR